MAFTTIPVASAATRASQISTSSASCSAPARATSRKARVAKKETSFVGNQQMGQFSTAKSLKASSHAAQRAASFSIVAKKGKDMLNWLEQLDYKLEKVPNSRYEATVTVPGDCMTEFFDGAKENATKDMAIPGFRRGKAPKNSPPLENMAKAIAFESAIRWASQGVLFKAKLDRDVLGEPVLIDDSEKLLATCEKGKPFTFKMGFDVWPEVKLGSYTGMKIKAEKIDIDVAKAVEETIERSLRRSVYGVPVTQDRAAKAGDIVTVTFQGYSVAGGKKGEPMEALTLEGQDVDLGNPMLHKTFVSSVAGMKKGERKEFRVDFEDDYGNALLRGKSVIFDLTVVEVKEAQVPELDDDIANEIARGQTAATLREHLRKTYEENIEAATRKKVEDGVVRAVRNIVEAEIPEVLIQRELERNFTEEVDKKATRERLTPEAIQSIMTREVFDRFAERYREKSIAELEWILAADEISKAQGLEPTAEEIEEKVRILKGMYKNDASFDAEETRAKCRTYIRMEKVLDFLLKNNSVEYVAEGTLEAEAEEEDWSDFLEDDSWMYESGLIRGPDGQVIKRKPDA